MRDFRTTGIPQLSKLRKNRSTGIPQFYLSIIFLVKVSRGNKTNDTSEAFGGKTCRPGIKVSIYYYIYIENNK